MDKDQEGGKHLLPLHLLYRYRKLHLTWKSTYNLYTMNIELLTVGSTCVFESSFYIIYIILFEIRIRYVQVISGQIPKHNQKFYQIIVSLSNGF